MGHGAGQTTNAISYAMALALLALIPDVRAREIQVGISERDLKAAIAKVPALRATLPPDAPIVLRLPPGTMRLTTPIRFDAAHGGTSTAPLILQGAADKSSRIVGTIRLTARRALARDFGEGTLPTGTLAIDLPPGVAADLDPRGAYVALDPSSIAIFQGALPLRPSRWPRTGFAEGSVVAPANATTGPTVALPRAQAARWAKGGTGQLWASGYWTAPWAFERVKVSTVDSQAATLVLAPMEARLPTLAKVRYSIANAIVDLTQPGDFVVDRVRRVILFLPISPLFRDVELAVAPQLLLIDGAHNMRIDGIAFDRSVGDGVRILNATDVQMDGVAVRQIGGNGIIVGGGARVAIRRSVVTDVAERGVMLAGGDRATLTPAGHSFSDGMIVNFGQESPSYRPAIELAGVGNAVTGSIISGGDHCAILLSGNDQRVEGNDISKVLRDTEDAGAIYMGRDWTARGMVVSHNYIHDLGGARETQFTSGVYLDDQFSSAEIDNNVIIGADYAVVIGGGRDNLIHDNLLIGQRRGGVHFDARGLAADAQGAISGLALKLIAVPFDGDIWRKRYPALYTLTADRRGHPDGNRITDNIVVDSPILVATPAMVSSMLTMAGNRQLASAVPSTERASEVAVGSALGRVNGRAAPRHPGVNLQRLRVIPAF